VFSQPKKPTDSEPTHKTEPAPKLRNNANSCGGRALKNIALQDLGKSDLTLKDIRARVAEMPENDALNVAGNAQGYVIPYFDMQGKPIPFFRVRYFDQAFKYRQPARVGNHIYYPPDFWPLLLSRTFESTDEQINIVICEGEKKAAAAVKKGILAVGLGGVDSWRNRIIQLPSDVQMTSNKNSKGNQAYSLRIQPGTDLEESINGGILAQGLKELFDTAVHKGWHLTIIFDTDNQELGMKPEVQRAAAVLGFEMVQYGLAFNQIHQIILPYDSDGEDASTVKIGLDDYLLSGEHVKDLQHQLLLLTTTESGMGSFPQHPNIKEYVSKILTRSNLPRDAYRRLATAILADMEARGKRIRSQASGEMYYFDRATRTLIEVEFIQQQKNALHATTFGRWLFVRYGLTGNDHKIVSVLHALFESIEPIENIDPHKLICRPRVNENIIRYQINDGQYAKVTASTSKPLEIVDNGVDGILFEAGHTEPMDADLIMKNFNQQLEQSNKLGKVPKWWLNVINDTRMKNSTDERRLAALIFYMSPWLNKWRGTQIPVEVVLGEAGSGKSSVYEHRLNVLTGRAELRNSPADLRDWHASVTSSGGLHVTDNVVLSDKSLRQRLSDELCRLVTEPDPHVEMRALYTNNKLLRLPITTTFAITAIQQPFLNADILQRSVIIEMDKASSVDAHGKMTYDSSWVPNQMKKYGGREAWIAHQMLVMHKFFQIVYRKWDPNYSAGYRLINVEQCLMLLSEVFGDDSSWVTKHLAGSTRKQVASGDWVLEGLTTYARLLYENSPTSMVTAGNISEWAMSSEDYAECTPMQNSRRLGRYLKTNQQLVREVCGICAAGKRQNVETYKVEPRDSWSILDDTPEGS